MENLGSIFLQIKAILEKHSEDFLARDEYMGSQAKTKKPGYHLYGKKKVSLFGKKPQSTYLAGVIQQKNYVSFYFSPIYSHPDLFKDISSDLIPMLKGKSCFNISRLKPQILIEIEHILKIGITKYKEIGWI